MELLKKNSDIALATKMVGFYKKINDKSKNTEHQQQEEKYTNCMFDSDFEMIEITFVMFEITLKHTCITQNKFNV